MLHLLSNPLLHWSAAVVIVLATAAWQAGKQGLDPWAMYLSGMLGLLGALWGGSVFAQAVAGNGSIDFLRLLDGEKGVFGAFAGAALVATGFLAWRRLPVLDYVEAAVPAIFAGYAVMRALCFMNGHCFGAVTDLPWAVRFPAGTEAFDDHLARGWVAAHDALSQPTHPTQLYHMLLGAVGFIVLLRMKADVPGRRLAAALMLYGGGRFAIEFFRGNAVPVLGPLDVNHIIAVVMFVAGLALWRQRAASLVMAGNRQSA